MTKKALILDLDNTIFKTRSMNPRLFDPFFRDLREKLNSQFGKADFQLLIDDLWKHTWDVVIKKHNIDRGLFLGSLELICGLENDLNIEPYSDYAFIRRLNLPLFLVTTGPESFQNLKIRSLGLENDFEKIVVNDPFKESRGKKEVFEELVRDYELNPGSTFVVGDNADSEISAGKALKMRTVQVLREGVVRGTNADYYIYSFEELAVLI